MPLTRDAKLAILLLHGWRVVQISHAVHSMLHFVFEDGGHNINPTGYVGKARAINAAYVHLCRRYPELPRNLP